jgi:hypothetical protein
MLLETAARMRVRGQVEDAEWFEKRAEASRLDEEGE